MKCVKKGEVIRNVADQVARSLVEDGWIYCPRHEWKEKVRGPVKKD